MLSIEQAPTTSAVVLILRGALRVPHTDRLAAAIQRIVRAGSRRVIVNLGEVADVDAAGLGALVAARNAVAAAGGRLTLQNPNRHVVEMLAVTRLLPVFDIASGGLGRDLGVGPPQRRRNEC